MEPSQILRMAYHLDRINLALAILLSLFEKVWNGDEIPGDRKSGALIFSVLWV